MLRTTTTLITLQSVGQLPSDLSGVRILDRLHQFENEAELWRERFVLIVGLLAVANEPLSENQIAAATCLSRGDVRTRLTILRQFLAQIQTTVGDVSWTIYHRTFADFLLNETLSEEFWCPDDEQHRRVLNWALGGASGWSVVDWRSADPYVLRHVVRHALRASAPELGLEDIEEIISPAFFAAKLAQTREAQPL